MTAGPARPAGTGADHPADGAGWRAATPELILAGVTVAVVAIAAGATSGWPGVVVVALGAAVLALVLARVALPRSSGQFFRRAKDKQQARAIFGYSQRRFIVATSVTSGPLYESELRPVLEHILAARLAEKHGVNLYTEPDRARLVFCRTRADADLWQWIDPAQAASPEQRSRLRHGIPRRALDRLITRMEQL
jgi:hypothetical protein